VKGQNLMQLCLEKDAIKVTKQNLQQAVISVLWLKMTQELMQKINMKLGMQPNETIMIKHPFSKCKNGKYSS
jgi:hypothetical protein